MAEYQYCVFKQEDLDKYLTSAEQNILDILDAKVLEGRLRDGKEGIPYVVAEKSRPEHAALWDMLEARVEGESGCRVLYKAETNFQEMPDYTGECPIPGYKSLTFSLEQVKVLVEGLREMSGRIDVRVVDPKGHEPEPEEQPIDIPPVLRRKNRNQFLDCASLLELNSRPHVCANCQTSITYSWPKISWKLSRHDYITDTCAECQNCGTRNIDHRLLPLVKVFRRASEEARSGGVGLIKKFVEEVLGEEWRDSIEQAPDGGSLIVHRKVPNGYEPEPDTVDD